MKAIRGLTVVGVTLMMAAQGAATVGAEDPALVPLDVPDSSIRVALPSGWDVRTGLDYTHFDWSDPGAGYIGILSAEGTDGSTCEIRTYGLPEGGLDEEAEAIAADLRKSGAATQVTAIDLAVGETRRIDAQDPGRGYTSKYLWRFDPLSYLLSCRSTERHPDDWSDVADSLAWQPGSRQARAGAGSSEDLRPVDVPDDEVPAWVPDDAISWHASESFTVQIPVSHDETGGKMMIAWCEQAVWLEKADGTFEERLECELTDEPVEPVEAQGTRPEETVFFSGGPCEWPSDFWYLHDGSSFWADSWAMSVEPDGSVLGVGMYGPEPQECAAD